MKYGIVGAGIGGMATAVRMAAKGHQVEVWEANTYPGGKLSSFHNGPYRFDFGPSLFTMPQYVDELFELAGRDPRDYYSYERLPVICRYFWEDGTRLKAHAEPEQLAAEAESAMGVPASRVLQVLEDSRRKYELSGQIFLEHDLYNWRTWWSRKVARALMNLPQLDVFRSMHRANARRLQHPKMEQFFDRFATYNGSNPYRAPGILNIIPHFEQHFGAYFPHGGMHEITRAVHRLAQDLGVRFYFGKKVDQIQVEKRTARGLVVEGELHKYDRIVSNMDVFLAYRQLLSDQPQPERILKQEKSSSAMIFYWGIGREFPELDLHNILFSEDYAAEFEALSKGTIFEDPTVYIHISSKYHAPDARPGGENWFTMINVPYNSGQDWKAMQQSARQFMLDKIKRTLGVDVAPLIETEEVADPVRIERQTGSHLGSLYGTSSNNRMAAFLRHPNKSRRIQNLYFCGGSVHPGGGIPLALLSARIIDQMA